MTTTNIKSLTGGSGTLQLVKRLLNMRYTPDEIISETGLTRYKLGELIKAGAPIIREGRRVWIHGTSFAEWFIETRKTVSDKKKIRTDPCAPDEVYCLVCKERVKYTETRRENRLSSGICQWGHKVSKIVSRKDVE